MPYELESNYKMNVLLSIKDVLRVGTFQKVEGATSDFACEVEVSKVRRAVTQKDAKSSSVAARIISQYFPQACRDTILET